MAIVKNQQQIDGIRKSCQLAADTLNFIEPFVKAGVSTETINNEAEAYMRRYGAIPAPLGYKGFPKAICTSINEVICHGIPKEQDVLQEGDIVGIDVTTILNGYYGDTCRTFPVGKISEEAERLLAVARDCLAVGLVQIRPGAPLYQIGKAIQAYAMSRGYSVVECFCGHGVGLSFHEDPQIHHDWNPNQVDERPMEPGWIFTVEPMINAGRHNAVIDKTDGWTARTADKSLSAQFEHSCLVTKDGIEILTL
jgi:methionyl aminopeptidase